MARTSGEQNIPSALRDCYRATLEEATSKKAIAKRYPYRLPPMQTVGGHPSKKQVAQRERFKTAISDFADVTPSERERWYDAEPPYGSFLWYYNYFIMSSLLGNADINNGGAGLIKSIQHKTMTIGAGTAEGSVAITAVDASKSVVMMQGSSSSQREEEAYYIVVPVYPYLSSLAAELVKCKWSLSAPAGVNTLSATISLTIIEYI